MLLSLCDGSVWVCLCAERHCCRNGRPTICYRCLTPVNYMKCRRRSAYLLRYITWRRNEAFTGSPVDSFIYCLVATSAPHSATIFFFVLLWSWWVKRVTSTASGWSIRFPPIFRKTMCLVNNNNKYCVLSHPFRQQRGKLRVVGDIFFVFRYRQWNINYIIAIMTAYNDINW